MEDNERHINALGDFLVLHGYSKATMDYGLGDLQDINTTTDVYQKEGADQNMLFVYVEKSPEPVRELLSRPFNSASLNLISSDRAYALLPKQTFIDKIVYSEPSGTFNVPDESAEGLTPIGWADKTSHDSPISRAIRRIGDKHTLTIDLDTSGFSKTSGRPRAVLEATTFQITRKYGAKRSRHQGKFFYSMAPMFVITSPLLAHTYTLWNAPVMSWGNRFTRAEMQYGRDTSDLRDYWNDAWPYKVYRFNDAGLLGQLDALWDQMAKNEKLSEAEWEPKLRDPWQDAWECE
jgi:hypothetical protein